MIQFENVITIDRAPEEVFAYLTDLRHLPAWNYAIERTEQSTPGPVEVGTRFTQHRRIPRRSVETIQVVQHRPPEHLTVAGDLGPFTATFSYDLVPAGRATQLTNTVELVAHGPARLAAPLLARRIKNAVAANLDTLKRILEDT